MGMPQIEWRDYSHCNIPYCDGPKNCPWKLAWNHKHLREIVCSLAAIVGGSAAAYSLGTASGGKSIHWPRLQCQSVLYGGWWHNYYCQQRQAVWANEWTISLDVYYCNTTSNVCTLFVYGLLQFIFALILIFEFKIKCFLFVCVRKAWHHWRRKGTV